MDARKREKDNSLLCLQIHDSQKNIDQFEHISCFWLLLASKICVEEELVG